MCTVAIFVCYPLQAIFFCCCNSIHFFSHPNDRMCRSVLTICERTECDRLYKIPHVSVKLEKMFMLKLKNSMNETKANFWSIKDEYTSKMLKRIEINQINGSKQHF